MTTSPLLHVARVNGSPVRYFAARPHPAPPWIAVDDLLRALRVPNAERESIVTSLKRAPQHHQMLFAESRMADVSGATDRETVIQVTVTPIVTARKLVRLAMDGDGAYGRANDATDLAFETGINAAIEAMPADRQGEVHGQLFLDVISAVSPGFAQGFVDSLEGDGPLQFIPIDQLREQIAAPESDVPPRSAHRNRPGKQARERHRRRLAGTSGRRGGA